MMRLTQVISANYTHTAGDLSKVVLSGLSRFPEATMAPRKRDIKDRFGWFRVVLPIVLAST